MTLSHAEVRTRLRLPQFLSRVPAGFPSPADDYIDKGLDLNEHLVRHPAATFFCRVTGNSMKDIGIFDGDLLIVDRSIEPVHGAVVLAALDGELTCKVLDRRRRRLLSANDAYPPIPIPADATLEIEGVVLHAITTFHVCPG